MTEMGFVKISKTRDRYSPKNIVPFELNYQFPTSRGFESQCVFRFPFDDYVGQRWFWQGYHTIRRPEKGYGDLVLLKLLNGNLVFHSDLGYEIVQGGVIVSSADSGDAYRIEFGFVSN